MYSIYIFKKFASSYVLANGRRRRRMEGFVGGAAVGGLGGRLPLNIFEQR